LQQITSVKVVHWLQVSVHLPSPYLKVHPRSPVALIEQPAVPQYLVLEDRRSSVQHDHVHLPVGKALQFAHQLQLAVPHGHRIRSIGEQDGSVHIGMGHRPPFRQRAKEIGCHHVRLRG